MLKKSIIYYVDFDNTLYDTHKLIDDMLNKIAEIICNNKCIDKDLILRELKHSFKRPKLDDDKDEFFTYNIYALAMHFARKYNADENIMISEIEELISDGNKYLYNDSIEFLRRLQEQKKFGGDICMLTYAEVEDHEYARKKIIGSGIAKYFDKIILTPDKSKEQLDYLSNEIVIIDDKPSEIEKISTKLDNDYKGKTQYIRLRRNNGKYSDISAPRVRGIKEIKSLMDFFFRDVNFEER